MFISNVQSRTKFHFNLLFFFFYCLLYFAFSSSRGHILGVKWNLGVASEQQWIFWHKGSWWGHQKLCCCHDNHNVLGFLLFVHRTKNKKKLKILNIHISHPMQQSLPSLNVLVWHFQMFIYHNLLSRSVMSNDKIIICPPLVRWSNIIKVDFDIIPMPSSNGAWPSCCCYADGNGQGLAFLLLK